MIKKSIVRKLFYIFAIALLAISMQVPPTALTEAMLKKAKGDFIINKNYTLEGKTIRIPSGVKLVFSGGSINNGTLIGNGTEIQMEQKKPAFGLDIVVEGEWNVPEVRDGWFDFDSSPDFVSNQIIKNMLAFSNDLTECHIYFEEKRAYFFELPYKGRTDLGNLVSYEIVDGKKKRNYSDLMNEEFAYLRIFTIPSNTHITINNSLRMLPTNQGAYFVFWEYGKENVLVDGSGTIAGDNAWHRYDSPLLGKKYFGEWGHIFKCIRCKNFVFKDITLSDSFGDCIMYSGSMFQKEPNTRWASDLVMDNVKILRARRNGVAVGARNVRITNCHFEGCGTSSVKGTSPRSAIDFEPDKVREFPAIGNQNVLMGNCTFKNNHYDVASSVNNLPSYGKTATTIRNCHFTSTLKLSSTYWMRFENCFIPFVYNKNDDKSALRNCRFMEFVDCDFGQYDTSAIGLINNLTNKFTNCRFNVTRRKPTD